MLKKMALYTVLGLALLACLSVGPAYGDEAAAATAQPTVATSASGCEQSLDLVFTTQAGVCPATTSWEPASELVAPPFGLRTCRCSCGQPCKTDADCGGGICSPGITCC
jgi:hypothetical protein